MKRVLFVDDEQQVLDALRDLLHKQRKAWKMTFSLGGERALDELARERFDVVVSDMQMPGVDGVALLQKVKELQPGAARIVLSGHAERGKVLSALPVAHRFLSKPCDADALRDVIERTASLQALLEDAQVRSLVGKVDRLPSVPTTYWELTRAMGEPETGLADLAAIVERDSAMAVKVLQLVNSSYFGLAQRQTSVAKAVSYLGTELLRSLALTAHVFVSSGTSVRGLDLDALQRHALLVARVARRLCAGRPYAAETFTAAVVHDVGQIVLSISAPAKFEEVLSEARAGKRALHEVEKERLGASHAEVGGYLLGLWGLPFEVVEATAYHHHPELCPKNEMLLAVHVADALVHATEQGADGETLGGRLNADFVLASPFAAELPRFRAIAAEEVRAVG
ncbi:MAG TPA: HDOD domain-containing protein [Polyangiaceae bacterium]|nr:HDOD domain-containing protein [Polyangiaceae bacterium]